MNKTQFRKLSVFYVLLFSGILIYLYSSMLYVALMLLATIIFSFFIFSFAHILSDRFQDGFYYYFGLSLLFSAIFEISILFSLPGLELIRHSSLGRIISLSLISTLFILLNSLFVLLGKRRPTDISKVLIINAIVSLVLVHSTLVFPLIPSFLYTTEFRFDRYFYIQMFLLVSIVICVYMVYTKKDLPANKSKHAYGLYFVTLIFKTEVLLNFLLTNSIIIIIFWSLHIISLFYIYVIYSRLAIDDPINTVFSVLKEREQDLLDEIQRRNELEDKLAETMEKIFNQNEEFQEILDNTGLLIFIKDLAGKYVRANRAFEDLIKLPREQIIGKTDFDLFNAKDAEIFHANDQEILATKLTLKMLETLTIDGFTKTFVSVKFPLGAKNRIYGICGIATDITDRLRTEEELWKAQKLESLGFLASGIAHDFNNYLMGAQSFLSFIEMEPDNPDEVKQNVETIKIALNKATVLTRQLITFAKGGNPIKKTINIKDLIMENAMFVMHGQKVKLQYENIIDCTLEIDPNQISQVLQNILLNAIQAIEKDYGIITINMKIEKNDETNEKLNSILPKGEYLKIQIKDNGMGIQPDHLKKVFDPYFTTKKNGTGLGLAISYSIVKRHGGHILIDSEINKGTIVSIFLPIYEVEQNIPTQQSTKQNLKFTGKVLIMEDDEMIANGLSRLLEKIGLEPEITNNGSDAIERFGIAKEMGHPFDFVILDLTVPGGMGGKECMEYLLKIDPNTIGIVSSGYSNDPILANPKDYGFFGILEKPYTYNDLYEQVKRIMEIREKNERSKA